MNRLWLVGKPRSDTLLVGDASDNIRLWLVGKPRSDTLGPSNEAHHAAAVVGRKAPLRYTNSTGN